MGAEQQACESTYATVHNRDLRRDFLSLALVHCLLTPFWIY